MRDLPLERAEHRFEAALHAQNRVGDVGIYRQNLHRLLPSDVGPRNLPAGVVRVRQETRILRKHRSRKGNDVRIHSDLASLTQPAVRLAQRLRNVLQSRMRRAQDQIEKRSYPARQSGGEHRLDMTMDLRLVELCEHSWRKALDAEAQHPKTRPPHGRQAL